MEKKKVARKLKLNRETLRALEGEELRGVLGGATPRCGSVSFCVLCPTKVSICVECV